MTKIILDGASSAKFADVKDRAEVCDEAGRTLGYFLPVIPPAAYAGIEVPFTEEELQRFEQEPGGRTLAEILADLEKL
jgi:hypothetical protein